MKTKPTCTEQKQSQKLERSQSSLSNTQERSQTYETHQLANEIINMSNKIM